MLASLTLLPLGKADASIAGLLLNRNVKMLNVKLRAGAESVPFPINVNFPFLGQPAIRFENFVKDF